MEACLPRHLRTNPIFSAYHSRPHARIGFVRIPAHHHNRPLMVTFGSNHTNLPSLSHRLSLHSYPLSHVRPDSLPDPVVSGENDGDDASWARTTAALATTTAAVVLACILAGGGGIRLKGAVGEPAAMAAMAPITRLAMPRGARAVQALLDTRDGEALTKQDLNEAKKNFYRFMQENMRPDYPQLQEQARVLIKSKEAENMIQALQRKFEEFSDADDNQNAVETGLILAEMLIYQVAANLMVGNKQEAQRIWRDLKKKEEFMNAPNSEAGEEERIPSTISEFEDALRKRLANISKARKNWWLGWR
ncbi:hypothetical protein ACLOJK_010844 [Asimina triloba]